LLIHLIDFGDWPNERKKKGEKTLEFVLANQVDLLRDIQKIGHDQY